MSTHSYLPELKEEFVDKTSEEDIGLCLNSKTPRRDQRTISGHLAALRGGERVTCLLSTTLVAPLPGTWQGRFIPQHGSQPGLQNTLFVQKEFSSAKDHLEMI